MSDKIIYSMALAAEEEPVPVFVGRRDGTIEKYVSIADVDLGAPTLVLRGHTGTVTGLSAASADELYSCAMDGTIRQWSAEVPEGVAPGGTGPRALSVSKFATPLRCLGASEGRLYAGGEDGSLNVKDGDRQSTWPGHYDVLCCIAFISGGALIVTGSHDHHVRVWDAAQGRCIRLLQGHANPVVALAAYEDPEADPEEPLTGAIVSVARDRTLKVWAVPNLQESLDGLEELQESAPRPAGGATVSFMEPTKGDAQPPSGGDDEEAEETGDAASQAAAAAAAAAATAGEGRAASPGGSVVSSSEAAPGVLKAHRRPFVLRDAALGTYQLPEVPFAGFCPTDEDGPAPYLYVGTTNGFVYSVDVRRLSAGALRYARQNRARVRHETREMSKTLRQSEALMRKECRRDVARELKRHVRAARKTAKEAQAKARAERAKARAEAREQRRQERQELSEDDEEGEEFEEEPDDAEEEEAEEEAEEDEEGRDPRDALSPEQRAELEQFTQRREAERDAKTASLRAAVQAHLAKLQPLAHATYDHDAETFHRLRGTTYARAGPDTVLALVALDKVVYAAQSERVKKCPIAPGVATL